MLIWADFFFFFSKAHQSYSTLQLTYKRWIHIFLKFVAEENFVFWFGAQFNSTHNFTQSGWPILFIPDLFPEQQKLDRFPHVSMLQLLLKNGQWDVYTGQRCSAKETMFCSLPNFCCSGKRSGLNRIGHPDWVKLCVELNYAPKQNTKFSSATSSLAQN